MRLQYYHAACLDDHQAYDIRARTLREARAERDAKEQPGIHYVQGTRKEMVAAALAILSDAVEGL